MNNLKKIFLYISASILLLLLIILLVKIRTNIALNDYSMLPSQLKVVNNIIVNKSNSIAEPSTCLESKPDDSEVFGHALAVNEKYLAVGDPGANRVVIYTRKTDGNWSRTQEIYPPKGSPSERRGRGFGYQVALNDNVIVIRAYDYKQLRNAIVDNLELKFETYFTSINNAKTSRAWEIVLPKVDLHFSSIEFLGDKIALLGRVQVFPQKQTINLFLIDPSTGNLIKNIEILDSDDYDKLFKEKYSVFDKENRFWSNYFTIDSDNQSLLIGLIGSSLRKKLPYLVTEDGKLTRMILDKKALNSPSLMKPPFINLESITISKNLLAISINRGIYGSWQKMLWKRSPQPSLIEIISEGGLIDVKDSSVLMSANQNSLRFGYADSDHTFIQVDENENKIIKKSKIRWKDSIKDKSFNYTPPTLGLIDSDSLLLSKDGIVVRLPIKNLPNLYEVKHSYCRSK